MSRSAAYILVTCDREGCDEAEEIGLIALAGRGEWDERGVAGYLREAGWTKREDGDDWCPGCSEDQEVEG